MTAATLRPCRHQTAALPLVETILEFAEDNGCLEALVEARDAYHNTPLLLSCKFKKSNVEQTTACLRTLLSRGAEPWAENAHLATGTTPLHWLCHYGAAEGVESLLHAAAQFDEVRAMRACAAAVRR